MIDISSLLKDKNAIIVELDNVLFPKKDYDLQVYYLFSQFLEMAGENSAVEIIDFIKETNHLDNEIDVFNKLSERFDFVKKYKVNFYRLYKTARLPLKLFMYQKMFDFLNFGIQNGIQVFIVTTGDPETQLNKIKQINWLGIEKNIRIFLADEPGQSNLELIAKLLKDNNLLALQSLFVSKNKLVYPASNLVDLPYILATEINDNYDQK